jgi:spore protease
VSNINFSIRTDLAIEIPDLKERVIKSEDSIDDDVEVLNKSIKQIKITEVKIKNNASAKRLGKEQGTYITIEYKQLYKDNAYHENIVDVLTNNIKHLMRNNSSNNILIIGLGNWNITPDALGPKVVSKVLVTRHIKNFLPNAIKNSVKTVSAISPGVLGITGLETSEVVKGICEKTKPDLLIIIDSLAARDTSRLNSTIQITNTGITPGMGMGNKRTKLSKEQLNTEIISIGVPTVIDAATLVNDTMDQILYSVMDFFKHNVDQHAFLSTLNELNNQKKYDIIKKTLTPYGQNMFVTPKEVDEVIDRLSNIISDSINIAIHGKKIVKIIGNKI